MTNNNHVYFHYQQQFVFPCLSSILCHAFFVYPEMIYTLERPQRARYEDFQGSSRGLIVVRLGDRLAAVRR